MHYYVYRLKENWPSLDYITGCHKIAKTQHTDGSPKEEVIGRINLLEAQLSECQRKGSKLEQVLACRKCANKKEYIQNTCGAHS